MKENKTQLRLTEKALNVENSSLQLCVSNSKINRDKNINCE